MSTARRGLVYAGPNAFPGIRVEVYEDSSVTIWKDGDLILNLNQRQAAEFASRLRRAHQRIESRQVVKRSV